MAGLGDTFQFNFGQVMDIRVKFGQQRSKTDESQNSVKAFGERIMGAWIGGDADEFKLDIARKLVPQYVELALAFNGIEVNLTKSSEAVSSADKQASSLASGLADTCSQIY